MKKKRRGCNRNLYHGYATFHNEKQADSSIMQGKTPEQIMARFVVAMMEQEKKDVIIEMDDYDFVARYKDIEKFRRLAN